MILQKDNLHAELQLWFGLVFSLIGVARKENLARRSNILSLTFWLYTELEAQRKLLVWFGFFAGTLCIHNHQFHHE